MYSFATSLNEKHFSIKKLPIMTMMFLDDQDCREESKIKYFSHLLALLKEVFGMLTIWSYNMKKILWHVKVRVVSASYKI